MPEVGFYLLTGESSAERYLYACKLIEKGYRNGAFAYVLTDSQEQSQQLDDLLWTFRQGSFVPHQLYQGELPEAESVVLIGSYEPPEGWQETIVNLSSECPQNFKKAGRIFEILDNNEEIKAQGRNRYRQYQQAGIEIVTHNI